MTVIVINIIVIFLNLISLSDKTKPFVRAVVLCVVYINLSLTLILLHQYDIRDHMNDQIIEAKDKTILNQDTIINLQDRIIKRLESK